jgi:hypothetical protein
MQSILKSTRRNSLRIRKKANAAKSKFQKSDISKKAGSSLPPAFFICVYAR